MPARTASDVVVLPLAATEQHGPHLPVTTDIDIGEGILRAALDALEPDVRPELLPMIEVGVSEEHASFPRTRSISAEAMIRTIEDVGGAVAESGGRRLVLANSHGGNRFAMEAGALRLRRAHGMLVVKASWFRFDRPADVDLPESEWRHGLHGGAVETAMMMHLHPERVRTDAVADFTSLGRDLESRLRRLGPEGQASFAWLAEDLHPAGVTGNALLATPGIGARLIQYYGSALAEVLLDAADFPLERLAGS